MLASGTLALDASVRRLCKTGCRLRRLIYPVRRYCWRWWFSSATLFYPNYLFPWDFRAMHLPLPDVRGADYRCAVVKLPLSDPYTYCSYPIYANIQTALFYPTSASRYAGQQLDWILQLLPRMLAPSQWWRMFSLQACARSRCCGGLTPRPPPLRLPARFTSLDAFLPRRLNIWSHRMVRLGATRLVVRGRIASGPVVGGGRRFLALAQSMSIPGRPAAGGRCCLRGSVGTRAYAIPLFRLASRALCVSGPGRRGVGAAADSGAGHTA